MRGGDPKKRAVGHDWPPYAETMVGSARLANVLDSTTRAIADGVPGDFVETGVWRGGTSIFMRGVLAALGDEGRRVWVCDSFQGLPVGSHEFDVPMRLHEAKELAVGVDDVKAAFDRYGLLDERVQFVEGWFRDTLPLLANELESIAVLRLDGDYYESTMDALTNLAPLVAQGGFVLVDDYGGIEACAKAVDEYRAAHGILAPLHSVDWTGVWWRVE